MNEEAHKEQETNWIPLKEASQLIGCSVKTIRRRIKAGTWRSTIEYQGQKAIRLVSREDVLRESTDLKKLGLAPIDKSVALQAIQGVQHQLGETLTSLLESSYRSYEAAIRRTRLYLILVVGIAAILITGLVIFFIDRQGMILERRMMDTMDGLSTMFVHSQESSGKAAERVASLSSRALRRADITGEQLSLVREDLSAISSSLKDSISETSSLRSTAESSREELIKLHRKISGLEDEVRLLKGSLDHSPQTLSDEDTGNDREPIEKSPESHQLNNPLPEKDDAGFLGIF